MLDDCFEYGCYLNIIIRLNESKDREITSNIAVYLTLAQHSNIQLINIANKT